MRAYRLLLRLYPASFRDEYGAEMAAIFERRLGRATDPLRRLSLWAAACVEVATNAGLVHLDILRQDVKYVARTLRRSRGFALTAIAIAALGIGATTAAFSIADFVLLRPLPFPDPDRLANMWEVHPGLPRMDLSPANYRDVKASMTSFETFGAYRGLAVNLAGGAEPQHVLGAVVTSEVFAALGIRPLIGRSFTPEEDGDASTPVLILSYGLWQTNFGGRESVIGEKTTLDSRPYTIVGVMPAGFTFPDRSALLWTSMRFSADEFKDRNDNYLHSIGRLRRGVSLAQARAEADLVAARLKQQYPTDNAHTDLTAVGLRDEVSARARVALIALVGAALCVLLIACANLANLLLARATDRARELAVRAAMGAGRERLARQLFTESLTLAAIGGVLGVALASTAVPLLNELVPSTLPVASEPAIDLRVLLFAALATTLTGVLFGTAPIVRVSRSGIASALAATIRAGGGARERLRGALVVAEIVLSVVLLVSTALLIKALWRVQAIDAGFRTDGVLTVRTALPMPKYETESARAKFYAEVLDGVRALPGVASAAYIGYAPMRGAPNFPVGINGAAPLDRSLSQVASPLYVTPGYFATLGIPIRAGRDVSESDTRDRQFVAVVSDSFVRRYWPGENPIGRHFTFVFADWVVVGVVGDVRFRGLERTAEPQVYLPYRQMRDRLMQWHAPKDLVVRSSERASAIVPSIRAIVRRADPQQPISAVRTLDEIVTEQTAPRATQVRVLAIFAAIAFVLAAVGIHGLLSFVVSQRAQEIGVRVALGAGPRDVLAMVAGNSARLGVVGLVAGVLLAYAAGRGLEALLAGLTPTDPGIFAAAVGLVVVMLAAGTLVPTLRALRIDPIRAIRAE